MRYSLKTYQKQAVRDVLRNLKRARHSYYEFDARSQFSLAATTGAGKTVMAAAVIESLFFGNDEFDFQPDAGAVVLWFSDDPSLNEQSRERIKAAASELDYRTQIVPTTFTEESFRPGQVYFLNTQKLAKGSKLVKGVEFVDELVDTGPLPGMEGRPDLVQTSIYDTITNTIANPDLTLYLILDEAHRGMRTRSTDRTTIVQRLINGQGTVPSIPIVFGISATVDLFEETMKGAKDRDALSSVQVDSQLVQESGLLKDDIVLSIPGEKKGRFDTVLLKQAVEKIKASTKAWHAYTTAQGNGKSVVPLLIVQMEDKPTQEILTRTIETVYEAWPDLPYDAVANVFGDHDGRAHADLHIGNQVVPYVEPQRVQDSTHIRVLLAKNAISTGWDCPRAEVLVSFRPARDRTHITQLLGRMMRSPLKHRIEDNQLLNSVDCLLPSFNRQTATEVANLLMRGATSKDAATGDDAGGGTGRRVLFAPVTLERNPNVDAAVWDCFVRLPSVTIPKRDVKPIRRLTALATALSNDGLIAEAVDKAFTHLHLAFDGRAVQYKAKVDTARDDVLTVNGETIRQSINREGVSIGTFSLTADARAIEDDYRAAGRVLSPALCNSYVDHLAGDDADEDDLHEAHISVAALARVPEIVQAIEDEADALARKWLQQTRVARKRLPDERQAEFDVLEAMSTVPEPLELVAPSTSQTESMLRHPDGTEEPLPTYKMHLMSDAEGNVPMHFSSKWEQQVVEAEASQPGFRGWYRNPERATKDSIAVAYKDDVGDWRALRPDFVFFSTAHDGTVVADLVDPHGHHLSDALPKLRGLAVFAEEYDDRFRRIESVAETGGALRVLDITKPRVREAIRDAQSARALYESEFASDY